MTYGLACSGENCPRGVMWILTNLTNGGTVNACAEDFDAMMVALLATQWGVDAGDLTRAIDRFLGREKAKADKALADAQAAVKADPGPDPDPPDRDDYDPGDQADDQGGMSEQPILGAAGSDQ